MASAVGSGMQVISSWDQVVPFAGRIVAYQADSGHFGATSGYTVGDYHFGCIDETPSNWSGGEKGYNMTKLLKPEAVGSTCALIASVLKKPIFIRLATKEETSLIGKAIAAGQARFEYMSDTKRIQAILERHLSELSKTC